MWRMTYTIGRNLLRLPKLIRTMRQKAAQEENCPEEERYEYVRYIVDLMKRTGHIRTEVFGAENLPREGGYMLYPNHQGKYDAYGIVGAHEAPCSVVMDKDKSYYIFVNEVIDLLRGKRMDIHDARHGLTIINEITQEVKEGRRYILFPEGGYTENQKNTLGEFKAGCFRISLRSQTPIVPVVLVDSYKVFNSWQLAPVTTQVHFLEPVYYDEYKNMKTNQIAVIVKQRIQQKLDELL